jgi:hypothetical protein
MVTDKILLDNAEENNVHPTTRTAFSQDTIRDRPFHERSILKTRAVRTGPLPL